MKRRRDSGVRECVHPEAQEAPVHPSGAAFLRVHRVNGTMIDEAARAAAELDSTLDQSIRKSFAERDRLEEELAASIDHNARFESVRARSADRNGSVTVTAAPQVSDLLPR